MGLGLDEVTSHMKIDDISYVEEDRTDQNLEFKGVSNLVEAEEETFKNKLASGTHLKIYHDKDMTPPLKQKTNIKDMQPSSHRVDLSLMGLAELTRMQRNDNPSKGSIKQGEGKVNTIYKTWKRRVRLLDEDQTVDSTELGKQKTTKLGTIEEATVVGTSIKWGKNNLGYTRHTDKAGTGCQPLQEP